MKLPALYKKTATGAQQEWSVSTKGNVIITKWGQTGGAIQEGRDIIKEGKNLGKKNETTPTEQAEFEAKALWEKKKKKGYNEDPDAAMDGKTDALIEGGLFPMLAHRFDKHAKKIAWPAWGQPKLDGHRCIVVVKGGKATMWSRTRKPIPCLPHIVAAFEELIEGDAIFDGELYHHDYKDRFEELTSFIRQQTDPKDGHEVVQYHIYDFPHEAGFEDRWNVLVDFFEVVPADAPIKLVPTYSVHSEAYVTDFLQDFLEQGYEGLMLRNAAGGYRNKRSYDLQKVKTFDDSEYEVVDVVEGRGKLAGHAMFVCQMEDGQTFTAKMKGELKELKKYLKKPDLAVGRTVTVQYQGLTTANKVPRFPVVLRFREDV